VTLFSRRGRLVAAWSQLSLGMVGAWVVLFSRDAARIYAFAADFVSIWIDGPWTLRIARLGVALLAGFGLGSGMRFLWGRTYREAMDHILVDNAVDRVGDFTPPGSVRWWTGLKTLLRGGFWVLLAFVVVWTIGGRALAVAAPGEDFWFLLQPAWLFGWICVGYASAGPVLDALVNIVGMGSGLVIANNAPGFDLRDVRGWRVKGLPLPPSGRYQIVSGDSLTLAFYAVVDWANRGVIHLFHRIGHAVKPKGVELYIGLPNQGRKRVFLRFSSLSMAGEFDAFLQEVIGSKS